MAKQRHQLKKICLQVPKAVACKEGEAAFWSVWGFLALHWGPWRASGDTWCGSLQLPEGPRGGGFN